MLAKQNDPIMKKQKINTYPIDYNKLNKLAEDFGKCFVPQMQLFAEQAFWLPLSNPKSEQLDNIQTPCSVDKKYFGIQKKEVSLDNDRRLDHINCQNVMNFVMHVDSVLANVLPADNKCLVDDNLEIERLEQENDHLFELLLSQDIVHICVNSLAAHNDCRGMQQGYIVEYNENLMLKVELAKKEKMILKGKNVVEKYVQLNNPNVTAPGMFKLDLAPLAPKLLNNRDVHLDYIKHSKEHADILREIVKHTRALRPLDSDLDSACKIVQQIQEVLVYVKDTFTSSTELSKKLVAVTPLNKNKKVRIKSSTSASRSQPSGNTKNNKILRTTNSNMKNKVEDHPRSMKSKSNKMNHVFKPVCNANVMHTMLNANFELICVKCNQCMFGENHDVCFLEFVNDVIVRSKSKSSKKSKNKNIWKPIGKVFTDIEYKWKPTGRTFTIAGNMCPITSTKVVPLKETTSKSVVQIVLWYLDSECFKHMTGNRSQLINFVYKGTVRFRNDQIEKIMDYGDYQMGKVMISQVAFRIHTCYILDLKGVDLLKGSRGSNLYTLSLEDMMLSSTICLLSKDSKTKSWLWHRRLSHLNFDYITTLAKQGLVRGLLILKFKNDHLCTACALAAMMASEQFSLGLEPQLLNHGTLSSRLVPNPPPPTPYVPPIKKDWDTLFRLMFDEYFNPPPSVASPVPAVAAPVPSNPTGSPSSTSVDQDASSPNNDPFFGVKIPKPNFKESSSRDVIPTNVHSVNQSLEHLSKWTKDYLLDNDSCIALTTFADADHTGYQDTKRSTSGSMQLLGDKLVSWSSKKQKSTAISSIEVTLPYAVTTSNIPDQSILTSDTTSSKSKIMNQEEIQQATREEEWFPKTDRAFLASTVVLEIYMQQFWHTITKVKDSVLNKFKLANKKCLVYVEVFRQALDIFPRVPGKEFIVPPSEKELLSFLVELGYKGILTHLPQMLIDHMHQPWRTLASIINKCLFMKTISNDRCDNHALS
ncbi:retrovirus-related pol polyprotein from transposon TNT 1-94, partial [Tanacetum coccineum]